MHKFFKFLHIYPFFLIGKTKWLLRPLLARLSLIWYRSSILGTYIRTLASVLRLTLILLTRIYTLHTSDRSSNFTASTIRNLASETGTLFHAMPRDWILLVLRLKHLTWKRPCTPQKPRRRQEKIVQTGVWLHHQFRFHFTQARWRLRQDRGVRRRHHIKVVHEVVTLAVFQCFLDWNSNPCRNRFL